MTASTVPAAARPANLTDAVNEVDTACAATRVALDAGGGRVSDAVPDDDTDRKTVAVYDSKAGVLHSYQEPMAKTKGRMPAELFIVKSVGSYRNIASHRLSGAQRKLILSTYLKRPSAKYSLRSDYYPGGDDTSDFESALRARLHPSQGCATQFLDLSSRTTVDLSEADGRMTWVFDLASEDPAVDEAIRTTYVVDDQARLVSYVVATVDADKNENPFDGKVYDYTPQSVTLPSKRVTVSWNQFGPAMAAVTLDSTLKAAARNAARSFNGGKVRSVKHARELLRTFVTDFGPEELRPKYRNIARGGLAFRTNPFDRTYHAWSVTVRNGKATARRVSP